MGGTIGIRLPHEEEMKLVCALPQQIWHLLQQANKVNQVLFLANVAHGLNS